MERESTCCFSGHRSLPSGTKQYLISRITDGVRYLIRLGYRDFLVGGALGFDTIAAQALACMKESGCELGLHFILPCKDHDAKWYEDDRAAYYRLLTYTDSVRHVCEEYTPQCMALRNRALVENSSACIACMTNPCSGTGQTLRIAREQGVRVFNLGPELKRLRGLTW